MKKALMSIRDELGRAYERFPTDCCEHASKRIARDLGLRIIHGHVYSPRGNYLGPHS